MLTRDKFNWKVFLGMGIGLFFLKPLSSQQTILPKPINGDSFLLAFETDTSACTAVHGAYSTTTISGTTTTISNDHFNKGLISDPLLLIQGRVAGLQAYNRGGDPNLSSITRIRGLSAFSQSEALIVIDGVAGVTLDNLDPNDIEAITVLKDGAAQAIYGIRASNGVFLITTKNGKYTADTLTISYQGQVATSNPYPTIKVADAEEFRTAGGYDFGSSTNWLDEVQRNGFSNTHGLALQGRKNKINYRLSGNYRNVEGVLRKSGFEQLGFRANVSRKFLKERLSVHLSAAYTDRISELGFNQAFRFATSFNPTIPLLAQDIPFTYKREQFGGFFETIGLFDSYNPKAIVELNDRNGKRQILNTSALLEYKLSTGLALNFRYAYQNQFSSERAFYSPQSYFRGNAYSSFPERKGRADLNDQEDTFSLYELYGSYNKKFGSTKLSLTFGTVYQDGNHLDNFLRLDGFSDESLLENKKIGNYSNWENTAFNTDTINNGWSNRLSAFFAHTQFSIKDKLFFNASVRYEGSSKLGENNRWGVFPAFGMTLDFKKIWNIQSLDQLKLRTGYGITGAIPDRGGLSRPKVALFEQADGSVIENIQIQANPDLKWEQKKETNIGLDFKYGKLEGFVDWYTRDVSDWIRLEFFEFGTRYANQNRLQSSGIELGLSVPVFDNQNFDYTTGVVFSAYQSKYKDLQEQQSLALSGGSATFDPFFPIQEGGELGIIVGPFFEGVDVNGNAVFADTNNDGLINLDPGSAFSEEGDFAVLGYGLPSFEWSWSHRLRYRSWQLDVFFRAASGHSLVNRNRLFYEQNPFTGNRLNNIVNTELAVNGLGFTRLSSLQVEDASFVKLDNLSLAKTFQLGREGRRKQLNISLTGQNLFTLTNYTGADPEPVLEDFGNDLSGTRRSDINDVNVLAPGIDHREYYLPARTFIFSVRLGY